jgi:hypothetical protein
MTEDRLIYPCLSYDVIILEKRPTEVCKLKLDLSKCATCDFYKADKTPIVETSSPE